MSSRSSTRPRSSRAWSRGRRATPRRRSEEHTSELQSQSNLVCRLLLEKKKTSSALALVPLSSSAEFEPLQARDCLLFPRQSHLLIPQPALPAHHGLR